MSVDKKDAGYIFGGNLKVIGELYAAGVFEFSDPVNWVDELVSEVTQLTRATIQAQEDLGNELNLPDRQSNRSSGGSPKQASGGSTSTSGTDNDPDRFAYVPSSDGVTPGQVKFLSSLLDERGMAIGDFLPLLNKESAKRAIHWMAKKGMQNEAEIFNGIL